jgi:hypothetical protein
VTNKQRFLAKNCHFQGPGTRVKRCPIYTLYIRFIGINISRLRPRSCWNSHFYFSPLHPSVNFRWKLLQNKLYSTITLQCQHTVNIFSMNTIKKSQYPHKRNIHSKIFKMHFKRTEIISSLRIISVLLECILIILDWIFHLWGYCDFWMIFIEKIFTDAFAGLRRYRAKDNFAKFILF